MNADADSPVLAIPNGAYRPPGDDGGMCDGPRDHPVVPSVTDLRMRPAPRPGCDMTRLDGARRGAQRHVRDMAGWCRRAPEHGSCPPGSGARDPHDHADLYHARRARRPPRAGSAGGGQGTILTPRHHPSDRVGAFDLRRPRPPRDARRVCERARLRPDVRDAAGARRARARDEPARAPGPVHGARSSASSTCALRVRSAADPGNDEGPGGHRRGLLLRARRDSNPQPSDP